MKANRDGFKVVEIVVKKVKWALNKNNEGKRRWFPLLRKVIHSPHPPLG